MHLSMPDHPSLKLPEHPETMKLPLDFEEIQGLNTSTIKHRSMLDRREKHAHFAYLMTGILLGGA